MGSHTDFYVTTATIIPVLLLVFAVQNRELLLQNITKAQVKSDVLLGIGTIIAVLTLAETAALAGLLGLQSSPSVAVIIFGIGGATQWMASSSLRGRPSKLLEELKNDEKFRESRAERRGVYFDIWVARILISLPAIITIIAIIIVLIKGIK
jgi:hypothetical protein